jgi:predicted amidohydrolase YtcJ
MLFTEHTDSPVVVPNSMRLLWAVVNRLTRSRYVLGPNQRISPYQGLLSITRNAAIQAFEEKSKGTLERFKLADLVILNSNPLKVPPESILEILVTETFKEGHSIYRRFDVSDSPLS